MKNQDQFDSKVKPAIQSVQGDPAAHNQQSRQPILNPDAKQSGHQAEQFKGKWQQQVGAAKIQWGKLTNDELLQSRGEIQKLSGLVQERYAVSSAIADKQVADFFAASKG